MHSHIPAWDPFNLRLLADVADPPDRPEYGDEVRPFLNWLIGALGPCSVVELDGQRPSPPSQVPEAAKDGVDLLHVTAEMSTDELRSVLSTWHSALSDKAVVALTAPGHELGIQDKDGAIRLRIGDGITLLPFGPVRPTAIAWLEGLSHTDAEHLGRFFDALGRRIAAASSKSVRRTRNDTSPDSRHAKELAHLRDAVDREHRHGLALAERVDLITAQRDALQKSTSWRLTAPLRLAIMALSPRGKTAALTDDTQPPAEPDVKQAFREHLSGELWDFLTSGARLRLPASRQPTVSILLVLYNQAALTLACLRSIVATVSGDAEIVIVDNASSDETNLLLGRLDGARVIHNAENRHFLHAVNQAAEAASGRDLLLLNNDACLLPGTLAAAQDALHEAPDIGAVGGKIVLVDGTLQEAGSIVWNDGTCLGYGRGRPPTDPEFQFRRTVDYCSGAFLLVKGDVFRALGGLDTAFAPAYYEETDFCMRLRAAGYRTIYEPKVEITHYEFGSSANSEQAFALQRAHWALFAERHAASLKRDHLSPTDGPLQARMVRDRKRLLYIDDRVPYPELGSGYPRAARMLTLLQEQGWFVTFYPLHTPHDEWDKIYDAFPREIEFILDHGPDRLPAFLADRVGYYDTILVSRPHNMGIYLGSLGDTPSQARLIYDAEALFAPREFLRLELLGKPVTPEERRSLLKQELDLTLKADTVIAVGRQEADIFRGHGCRDVHVLAHGVAPRPIRRGFDGRRDILFVGSLAEDKSPNADSVIWFVNEVMPMLDERIGTEYRLLAAGQCHAEKVRALAGPRMELLGMVDDLVPLYARCRVFIAPTRFAAGRPFKVDEAVSYGLPVVATKLLARQLDWTHGRELLVGSTAEEFAAGCARLYTDKELWYAVRRHGQERLMQEAAASDFPATLRAIIGSPAVNTVLPAAP